MPAGVARSKFVSPLAKSLGWPLQRLRSLFNRNGYHAPYLDEIRGLKICLEAGLDIRPYLDKAKHPPEFLASLNKPPTTRPSAAPAAPVSANELVLSQSPAPPQQAQLMPDNTLPVPTSNEPLIVRLARLLGGTGPEEIAKVRAILKRGNIDGRSYKNEDKCLQLMVAAGVRIDRFERRDPNHPIDAVARDITAMPVTELRLYAEELQGDNAAKDVTIANLQTRIKRISGLLETAKNMMTQEYRENRRDDESESESLLRLARAEANRRF